MLRYFPPADIKTKHEKSDYYIVAFTFYTISVCLIKDTEGIIEIQYLIGFFGWICLLVMLRGESAYVRAQVVVAMLFATLGEFYASVYMGGYVYKADNLPFYVTPGHGMIYLTALALGRSGFFQIYARNIATVVVIFGGIWSLWGISGFSERMDVTGAILYLIFILFLFYGRNPMLYLGAFFITNWLEIIGTSMGVWTWAIIDPASGLYQGNPPSGVAAYYCLVDAVAVAGAKPALYLWSKLSKITSAFSFVIIKEN